MIARLVDPIVRWEIELSEAKEVVRNAEQFVQTVERVFILKSLAAKEYENPTSKDDGKVSEPAVAKSEIERKRVKLEPISLEGNSPAGARKLVAIAAANGGRRNRGWSF
jgi:hypothetical protein